MKTSSQPRPAGKQGFNLIELLVVIAIIAILAGMLLPALGRAKAKATGILCMNNTKQLMLANHMYQSDNSDRFPASFHGGLASSPTPNEPRGPWVVGWLDWGNSSHNTNIQYLIDPRYSKMAQYFANTKNIFKCPADKYLSPAQRRLGWKERVRSVSGNIQVGDGNAFEGPYNDSDSKIYAHAKKASDLTIPGPSDVWVYVDEHPDSINDAGCFSPHTDSWSLIDMPATYHNGACGYAFADGHSEVQKWKGAMMKHPKNQTVSYQGFAGLVMSSKPGDVDIQWMRYKTPRKGEATSR